MDLANVTFAVSVSFTFTFMNINELTLESITHKVLAGTQSKQSKFWQQDKLYLKSFVEICTSLLIIFSKFSKFD